MCQLQPLPQNLEPTRESLHAYALAVAAVPRVHAAPHPRWWHVSLELTARGLVTDLMTLPDGGVFQIVMDLHAHDIVVETNRGEAARFSMKDGTSGKQMGANLIEAVSALGLDGDYDTARFDNNDSRPYDERVAADLFAVLSDAHQLLVRQQVGLTGEVGPIQLWPHGFDIAFEWFATRQIESETEGGTVTAPAQLNFGFYPAGRAYFYSNPWPFESDLLLNVALPHGAAWHTDGWEGTVLYYDEVAGSPDGRDRVAEYATAVYDATAPTLLA